MVYGIVQVQTRTENGVTVPHLWERGGVEVFQPKLVIFRAEPDFDASFNRSVYIYFSLGKIP